MPSRFVAPPLLHGCRWCTWHRPGGQSQPSAVQPPCSMPGRSLGLGVEAAFAAEVEDFRLPVEDGGDDPGLAGHPAGLAGGDLLAGVELGCLQSAEESFEGHGDHDGGVHSSGLRESLGRVGLDVLLERQAHLVGGGLTGLGGVAVDRGVVFGRGLGEEGLLQHRAVAGRDGELPVAPAVAIVVHPEHRRRVGGLFFLLQQFGFVGVRGGRVDDLEDPLAQDPQVLASWSRAWSSSHCCAFGATQASASSGRASTALTITAAWSTSSSPAASAVRTGSCSSVSRALASLRSRWVAARVVLVWWAHQFAVEVAPASSPILLFSPWATTRSSSSATLALTGSADSVARVSCPGIDHVDLSVSASTSSWISRAATVIGCPRCLVDAVLVMDQVKQRPPTVRAEICATGLRSRSGNVPAFTATFPLN